MGEFRQVNASNVCWAPGLWDDGTVCDKQKDHRGPHAARVTVNGEAGWSVAWPNRDWRHPVKVQDGGLV